MPPGRRTGANLTRQSAVAETLDPKELDPALAAYLAGDPTGAERFVTAFGSVVRDAIARFLAFRVRGRHCVEPQLHGETLEEVLPPVARRFRAALLVHCRSPSQRPRRARTHYE